MRGLLFALCVVLSSVSYGVTIRLGVAEPVRAPMCMDKAVAIQIAQADVDTGIDAAAKIFNDSADCDYVSLVVKPLRVVYTGTTPRKTVVRVIEVEIQISDFKRNFWMLAEDVEIVGLQKT